MPTTPGAAAVIGSESGGGGGIVPPAGDIGGTTASPKVTGFNGVALSGTAATAGQAYVLSSGGVWVPTSVVSSVTAGDTSIVVGGTATAPTLEVATLDVIATDHPPAAAWSNNSKKITGLANGTASTDAAAYGQIPVPANGYGISGNTGSAPTPAVGLSVVSGYMASDYAQAVAGTSQELLTSGSTGSSLLASLAVGTWMVFAIATTTGTSTAKTMQMEITGGTSSPCTFTCAASGSTPTVNAEQVAASDFYSLTATWVIVVSAAGSLGLWVATNATSDTWKANYCSLQAVRIA